MKEDFPAETAKEIEDKRMDELDDDGNDEQDIISEAREAAHTWDSYFGDNNLRGRELHDFLVHDQWSVTDRAEFQRTLKPALSFNKCADIVRKVIGEQRQNTPDIMVRSKSGKASQEDINMHTDIIQSIAYNSETDIVYQTAFESALKFGYGVFEIEPQYKSPFEFEQIIKYKKISTPDRCFFDPRSEEPSKWDSDYCGRYYIITKEEFKSKYPNIEYPASLSMALPTIMGMQWTTKDTVVVMDWWKRRYYPVKLLELSTGEAMKEEDWNDLLKKYTKAKKQGFDLPPLPEVHRTRMTYDYKIKKYRVTYDKVLEVTDFPSKYHPLVFVDGDSDMLDGKQFTKPLIYHAQDAQKFLNYLGSEIASQIKNSRREVWLGTPDNIIGDDIRRMWLNPENQQGILIAKPDGKSGQLPQKVPPTEIPQTLMMHFERATNDIKQIIGYYDSSAAGEGPEVSGRAIYNRMSQGSGSVFVYHDNLARAIAQGARICLDLLPKIYDTERDMMVRTQSGTDKKITINQMIPGGEKRNEIKTDDMDIEIKVGPSFAMQKTQAVELLIKLLQVNPQSPAFPLIIDIIAKNLDLQYTPQLVDRLESLVPPQILAKEKGLPPPPPQPDPQQEMMKKMEQQQQQMLQMQMQEKERQFEIQKEKNAIEMEKVRVSIAELQQKALLMAEKSDDERAKAANDFSIELLKLLHEVDKNVNAVVKESKQG